MERLHDFEVFGETMEWNPVVIQNSNSEPRQMKTGYEGE